MTIVFLSCMISLKKALEMMRRKDRQNRFIPFSLTFVSCNFHKKEGGELVTYNHVTLPQRQRVQLESVERLPDEQQEAAVNSSEFELVMFRTSGGEIKHCHIHLITRFNGEKVI